MRWFIGGQQSAALSRLVNSRYSKKIRKARTRELNLQQKSYLKNRKLLAKVHVLKYNTFQKVCIKEK